MAQSLTFGYRGRPILHDVSFSVGTGLHAITGGNGSGKTTLLRLVATALKAPQNSLLIDGCEISGRQSRKEARAKLSYLPQLTRPDIALTVKDWLEFGAWLQGVDGSRRSHLISDATTRWQLDDLLKRRMSKLSVGQRRRVDLARACLRDDLSLLVLDEPFAALDQAGISICKSALEGLAERSIVLFSDPTVTWEDASIVTTLGPS